MTKPDVKQILRTLRVYQPGEKFEFVVCMRYDDENPLLMIDNEIGQCARCGTRIQFRPDCPDAGPKVCVECALALIVAITDVGKS